MLWFLFRWLFWRPRYTYEIVVGTSFASAHEAAKSAELKTNSAGGEAISIAADAMCCAIPAAPGGEGDKGGAASISFAPQPGTVEWDVYVLIRK